MIESKIKALGGTSLLISVVVIATLMFQTSVGFGGTAPDESINAEKTSRVSLWSTIVAGGPIGFVIILASCVAVALAVEDFITIRRERMVPEDLTEQLGEYIQKKRYDKAKEVCAEDGSFLAQVMGAGLNQVGAMFGFFDMQNAMQEVSEREISKLYRKLEYLSFIASTTPMLGLLGTVTGMIASFNTIAASGGAANPSDLAGGISMALVTTCMGLIVAIPTMFFVAFFRKRIDSYVAESETVVEKLMGHFRHATK
jgi:biopolymer transport protein ExbB